MFLWDITKTILIRIGIIKSCVVKETCLFEFEGKSVETETTTSLQFSHRGKATAGQMIGLDSPTHSPVGKTMSTETKLFAIEIYLKYIKQTD